MIDFRPCNEDIENCQNKLCEYLKNSIPVSWDKIVLYAKCKKTTRTARAAFREKTTGIVVTNEFWFDRYESYPVPKMDLLTTQIEFVRELNRLYRLAYGDDNVWATMAFIIEEDGSYHLDLSDEMPNRNMEEERNWLVKTYFNTHYKQIKGLYPSVEVEYSAE